MTIVISGATGLVGTALGRALASDGHRVIPLARPPAGPRPGAIVWEPSARRIDAAGLEGVDAVIHLAGESIAAGRWSAARKARIRDSRVGGTALLAETIARLQKPPRTLVCASAVGYYGSRGDDVLREESPPGTGFLADTCRAWEAAAAPAARRGVRVAHLRFGMILSRQGGALKKMLPPFRLGAGGPIGDGRQYVSWVALDDVIGAIRHVLLNGSLAGPVNVVAPQAVTSRDFARALGRAVRRPAVLPMPAVMARLAFGEMADELLLSSQRVEPARLAASGYRFLHPDLDGALRHLLQPRGSARPDAHL